MSLTLKQTIFLLILGGAVVLLFLFASDAPESRVKLYWFIPDGTRADPDLFKLFEWAQDGELPNIKKLMDQGAYGYSIPDFPSHTPTNFASLLTGARPIVHGVADGPMHVEGAPLARPSVGGFTSAAKKVAPIWTILENEGKDVTLLSVPGSTPPELKRGTTIRGRWGGWGADTPAIIFEPESKIEERKGGSRTFRLFLFGEPLTRFIEVTNPVGWSELPESFSPIEEISLAAYGGEIFALVYDTTDDGVENYDRVRFSPNKTDNFVDLTEGEEGEWSKWFPTELIFDETPYKSEVRFRVIKLWDNGDFRIRVFYNNINQFLTAPSSVARELTEAIGPMVDFLDNWPAQLVHEEEDEIVSLEEAWDSFAWHQDAAGYIMRKWKPDVFIQDIYTPNQMLTSRWWMGDVDLNNPAYDEKQAEETWKVLKRMYKELDAILGEAMENADENTLFVFSSDHGIVPLYRQVRLNNLFAEKGWLSFTIDEKTGEPAIDWDETQVIFLNMAHIYIKPEGLGGNWTRGEGEAYETLRREVLAALQELEDENGVKPLVQAAFWEDAPKFFELPTDRVGDIVLETTIGYQWWEEVTEGGELFTTPLNTGYKQTVNPKEKGMWTPFVIAGPGVKSGVVLEEPISHIDQLPTILTLMGVDVPSYVQGRVLEEIVENNP